jgi:hypothetical protein
MVQHNMEIQKSALAPFLPNVEIQERCGIVDVWRDNHVLIFYAIIYCHYAEYTDELQLDDLQVAG